MTDIKKTLGALGLLESEIKTAQDESYSAAEAARKLGVSYNTYKKYARLYGIMERVKNPPQKGMKKEFNPYKGKYPLNELLEGLHPNYPEPRLRGKILKAKVKPEKCEVCGFSEKRITDDKVPLMLAFKDGDRMNHRLENLELV